jgi:predicted ATPase/DNA-binding SARP family transcriptional activator
MIRPLRPVDPLRGAFMIRFRILGGLELRDEEGTEVRSILVQPRRVALLVGLALAGEAGFVRRDTLMGRLWPHSPQDRARHSLNQGVYSLRRSLGRQTVVSRGEEEIGLDADRLWCDARAFEIALVQGRDEEALELFRGELLPGFFVPDAPDFESWLEERRSTLRSAAAEAAWRLSGAAEADHPARAAAWARKAVALAGEDELGVRRLLRLLEQAGDRSGAVAAYEAFARRIRADPGVEPSPETRALIREIRGPRPEPEPPPRAVGGSVLPPLPPRPGTPLVGREEEMARLDTLLTDPHSRLVTLVGPGGVGKTRLALELLHVDRGEHLRDRWFVALAGVESPELVPAAVAQGLGLAPVEGNPAAAVVRHLARAPGLLVLDNLDHLVESAPFVSSLLEGAPDLTLVATSREALRLRDEWVFPLEGLDPVGGENGSTEVPGAVRLFAEAARRMTGSFDLEAEGRERVVGICRLVEGIPLAIELAASWSRAMSLDEIAREIEASRGFLARPFRDGPTRHRSLEATFERSWVLLGARLREVLARLSVFRGGFTREGAEAVAGASLDEVAALVDKSLVRCAPGGRWELLEVIREFAAEKLASDPAMEGTTRGRHALHFARFMEELEPGLAGPAKDDALARVAADMDNVRAAWKAAARRRLPEAFRAAAAPLFTVFDCWGWHREAEAAFAEALEGLEEAEDPLPPGVEAILLARRGAALLRLGRGKEGGPLLRRALERAREGEAPREAAFILDRLSLVAYEAGEFPEAVKLQDQALALRRQLDDPRQVTTSLNNLGSLHYAMGEHDRAREFSEECLTLQRRLGDRTGEVISLQNLGHISMVKGRPDEAERWLLESLAAARHLRHGVLTARSLLALGTLANARGAPEEARRYLQPALARAMQVGAESLAAEAVLGTAWSFRHQGDHRQAVELVGAVLAHPDLEPGPRAAAERLLQRLGECLDPGEVDAGLVSGRALGLREAAAALAGPLPVEPGPVETGPEG